MKRYIRYRILFVFALLSLCMTSCNDDTFDFDGENGQCFTISAKAEFFGETNRAILDESVDAKIDCYSLLVFSTNNNDANLIYMKEYNDLTSPTKLILPREDGFMAGTRKYFAVLLGNVPLPTGEDAPTKLSDLYALASDVSETDNNPTDASKFTWSAFLDVDNSTKSLNFNLKPNVAKVKFTIENTSEDNESTEVVGVQVRNVLNKVRYAQNALSSASKFTKNENSKGGPSYIDYDKEEIRVASNGGKETFYWYVPCNMLGEGSRKPTVNIPSGSTFLEVTGVRNVDYLSTIYKIYLGVKNGSEAYADMTNFDVRPNYVYDVNVTITNDGLDFDVTNNYNTATNTSIGLVKLPSNANCYMINPNFSKTANGYPVYELPIDRINECWLDPAINDASMSLGTNDEWVMDVMWQDINAQVIKFCDKNGNNASNTYSGTGVTPAYFKIVPSAVTSSHYGNILVGVKKKNTSDYLWSWHLWVTNYNPDVATPYSIAKGLNHTSNITANSLYHENSGVTKINGNVQHWWHIYDFYWGANNKFKSKEIWSPGGLYEDCWMMDRNIGAIRDNVGTGDQQSYGCYYQWGSKNPYPHATYFIKESTKYEENKHSNNLLKKLYKITGTDTTHFTFDVSSTSLRTLKEVTKKPNICYFVNDDSKFELYDSNHKFRDNYWASLKSNPNNGYSQKSIFDPCPPGWCVPMYNTFDLMTYDPRNDFGSTYRYYRYHGLNDNNNYADGTFPTVNIWRLDEGYLNYKMKDHVEAVFMRKNKEGDANKIIALYAVFPMQGAMSMEDNGISGNSRSMYWFAESSVIPGEVGKGESIGFFSVIKKDGSNGSNVYHDYSYVNLTTSETRYQEVDRITNSTVDTYSHIWNGRATHRPKQKSRGHTIRCIQVPGGEQLKYYNK